MSERVLAVAHRAGNDLNMLKAATDLGVDVLEADVKARGEHLEIRHSKHLRILPWMWDRGEKGIEWTHTREPQLRLQELLEALEHGHPSLMLDLKGPGRVGTRTSDIIHQLQPTTPILICSRWWPGLRAFNERRWARQVLTARNQLELTRLKQRTLKDPPHGVSLHPSLITPRTVGELRERVELVLTWQVNNQESLQRALEAGINGVISDTPEILKTVLELNQHN